MKLLAYFLPQFYPTPENDKYWGKGFTDWTNVKSSKPLFKGHKQPFRPSKFGMYTLNDRKVLQELSNFSIEKGIDGFGYFDFVIWMFFYSILNPNAEENVSRLHS